MIESQSYLVSTLLCDGTVDEAAVRTARDHAAMHGTSMIESLIVTDAINARSLATVQAHGCECPFVDLDQFAINLKNARLLPRGVAERLCAFPLFVCGGVATVAVEDPLDLQAIDELWQVLGLEIEPVVCDRTRLVDLINAAYRLQGDTEESTQDARRLEHENLTTGDEPVVAAVNQIMASAIQSGASDVHINPDESTLHLRYRVDGELIKQHAPPLSIHGQLVQRLKVMARLDLTQTRRPQDGKFRIKHNEQAYDIRLSLVPTVCGENVVMRILRPSLGIGSIEDLGMPETVETGFRKVIASPHGLMLVTGPTGSGKTTTLYTAIGTLNTPNRNIVTIEDPVEIRMNLLRQVQVNHEIGLSFASVLRSVLRQDPDVVLVGEIRDEETAHIALQASMTGHLVLSTLHTNDTPGAITRLIDMGLPAFAINGALRGVLAQRLLRKICDGCAENDPEGLETLRELVPDLSDRARAMHGVGCPRCMSTGSRGRLAVYEFLPMSDTLRTLIDSDASEQVIREQAAANSGYEPLWMDAARRVQLGQVAVTEMMKVCSIDAVPGAVRQRMAA
jgi:type II secretory ATPase GspE/PulE/Tfp pilus assembly ATPase PilB-like protein